MIIDEHFECMECRGWEKNAAELEDEIERLKAERDQHKEGEAALVVERDVLWRRADELEQEVEQLKWSRTSGPKADAAKGGDDGA